MKYNFSGGFQIILLDEQKAVSSSKARKKIVHTIYFGTYHFVAIAAKKQRSSRYIEKKIAFLVILEGSIKSSLKNI